MTRKVCFGKRSKCTPPFWILDVIISSIIYQIDEPSEVVQANLDIKFRHLRLCVVAINAAAFVEEAGSAREQHWHPGCQISGEGPVRPAAACAECLRSKHDGADVRGYVPS